MLRKLRITVAAVFFLGITLLLLDITGALQTWLGWMARVQLLPAVLALNLGVIVEQQQRDSQKEHGRDCDS